jgi:hypothetical protein
MQQWNGTVWEKKPRLFVARVATGASSVTSIITYALKRQYISPWIPVSANNSYNFGHNIGVPIVDLGIAPSFSFSLDNMGANVSYAHDVYAIAAYSTGIGHLSYQSDANNLKCAFGGGVQIYNNTIYTAGYYRLALSSAW